MKSKKTTAPKKRTRAPAAPKSKLGAAENADGASQVRQPTMNEVRQHYFQAVASVLSSTTAMADECSFIRDKAFSVGTAAVPVVFACTANPYDVKDVKDSSMPSPLWVSPLSLERLELCSMSNGGVLHDTLSICFVCYTTIFTYSTLVFCAT